MTKKKTSKKKGDEAKKDETPSTARKTPEAKARSASPAATGMTRDIEADILRIMKTSIAAEPNTPELLCAKLKSRFKQTCPLDEVHDALKSLETKGAIQTCYAIKPTAPSVEGDSLAEKILDVLCDPPGLLCASEITRRIEVKFGGTPDEGAVSDKCERLCRLNLIHKSGDWLYSRDCSSANV